MNRIKNNNPLLITAVWTIGSFTAQYKSISLQAFILLSLYAGMLYMILWGIEVLQKGE